MGAGDSIREYNKTAASNTSVGGINLSEGVMVPSDLNNSHREVMSHLAAFADGTDGIDVLSLVDDDASAAIKFQAPATVTTTTTFTLPDGDGSANSFLKTDGSATLEWGQIASQSAAEAGTDNEQMMTPLRTAQAITAQSKGLIDYAIYTADGSYAVPAGTKKLVIKASGGGGGGGGRRPGDYAVQNGSSGGDTTVTQATLSVAITAKGGTGGRGGTDPTGGKFQTGSSGGTTLNGGGSVGGSSGGHIGSIGGGTVGGPGSLVVAELDDPTEETITFTVGSGGAAGNTTYMGAGAGGYVEFWVFG